MGPVSSAEECVGEPGLVVRDITADEATALAVQAELERRWATSVGHRSGTPGARQARGDCPRLRGRAAPRHRL
ncbi:DUF6207 family protein [Streptomyces sp. NPDC051994]|uniref:DUF6207 family protein n=1 Tax=unclassified Streptomyces TaxID=2593676 RepID=UPI00342AF923